MELSPIHDFKLSIFLILKLCSGAWAPPARLNFFCPEDDFDGLGGFIAWWVGYQDESVGDYWIEFLSGDNLCFRESFVEECNKRAISALDPVLVDGRVAAGTKFRGDREMIFVVLFG